MITVRTQIERWELVEPFTTARDSITHVPVLLVTLLARDGTRGWAEAAGVDYDADTDFFPEKFVPDERNSVFCKAMDVDVM